MRADPNRSDASINFVGRAEDIAHTCLYFASDMSAYVTGMTMMQDGGASYQAHRAKNMPAPDYYEEMVREYLKAFPYPEPGDEPTKNTSGIVNRVKI
jgi:hypothetical protein